MQGGCLRRGAYSAALEAIERELDTEREHAAANGIQQNEELAASREKVAELEHKLAEKESEARSPA